MTQEEIEDFAYQVRRKYQDEQAELKGGMCEHIMFDAMEIQKGVLLGVEFAQSKMYSEEDMKNAFDSGREFNSLDGVVDIHIVLPMGGDMTDLQPLYPTFEEWFETVKKK